MTAQTDKATELLVSLIQKASDGIDSAVAFSQAQIPDVVSQLLVWNAVSSALLCAFGLILIITPIITLIWLASQISRKKEWAFNSVRGNSTTNWDGALLLNIFIGGISLLAGFIFMANNFDWLKILIAPKLYLLEYAASLIK